MSDMARVLFCRERLEAFGTGTEIAVNTPAGTHDGDDLTEDAYAFGATPGFVNVQYVIDNMVPEARRIDFLRVRWRARATVGGANDVARIFGGSGPNFFYTSPAFQMTTNFEEYYYDTATNGETGKRWQPEEIVDFFIQCSLNHDGSLPSEQHLSELFVEVWVLPEPKELGPYTRERIRSEHEFWGKGGRGEGAC